MSKKQPQGLSCQKAWQILQDDPRAMLIDIRSSMEYLFIGHPLGAINVPWIDEPDWKINPHFVPEVRKVMLGGLACEVEEGCAPIILICRSGKRSQEAGKKLLNNGLSNVYHVSEGFEGDLDNDHHRSTTGGWRFHGLPWQQC